jgi:hypothetical protein
MEAFLVFNEPPYGDELKVMSVDEENILWMASILGRKNGTDKPAVFSTKKDAQDAINTTKEYAKKMEYNWKENYVIQPIILP